jgi:hypothetical protein
MEEIMRKVFMALLLASSCVVVNVAGVLAQGYGPGSSSNSTVTNTTNQPPGGDWGRAEDPNLRPSYPAQSSGSSTSTQNNPQNINQAGNYQKKRHSHIHLIRAAKHMIGFSVKAPFELVP